MKKLLNYLLVSFVALSTSTCSWVRTPNAVMIRSHKVYPTLSVEEKYLVEKIMAKAERSDRKRYYFTKLQLLLDTPKSAPVEMEKRNIKAVEESIQEVSQQRYILEQNHVNMETYLNKEELYELTTKYQWNKVCPSQCFYVAYNESGTDVLVNISVRLIGSKEAIEKVMFLEDAVEKFLSLPGFSVNLIFTGMKSKDVFDINIDYKEWPNNYNWSAGYEVIAHELCHSMGLPDEYDRIKSHAGNGNLTVRDRLYLFWAQMNDEVPEDADRGIMGNHWYKPLERHVCAIIKMDGECVKNRNKIKE